MKYNIKTQKHLKRHSKKTLKKQKKHLLKTAATALSALFITAMLISCTACSRKEDGGTQNTETVQNTETTQNTENTQNTDGETTPDTVNDSSGADGTSAAAMISATAQPTGTSDPSESSGAETSPTAATSSAAAATSDPAVSAAAGTASAAAAPEYKGLVVIDPGHQKHANTEQEPVGPGASETKIKVSGGTTGTATGVPEYELTLDIGLQLRDKLLERGYQVIMVRDTNEVDISNSERAEIANEADADVFIRLHANGSPDSSVTGAMTICQTPANPYNGDIYEQSRALSENILDSYIYKTGINRQNIWETDTMSGINWSKVPATILEMGFMSNTGEDRSMQDDDMQQKMVEGIADGIDEYMKQFPPKEREETFFRQNEEEEASSEQNNSRETSEEDLSKEETSGETEESSEEESVPDGKTKAETKEGIKEETEGPPEGTAAAEDN